MVSSPPKLSGDNLVLKNLKRGFEFLKRGVGVLLVLRGGGNMGELAKIGCKEGIQRYKIELYTCSFVLSYSQFSKIV